MNRLVLFLSAALVFAIMPCSLAASTQGELQPVPHLSKSNGTALSYHSQPVDLSKPISTEPLVKASDLGLSSKSYYYIADGSNVPYKRKISGSLPDVWLRKSVANKLVAVNRELAPMDLEVHIFDGYRPIETQQALWEHFIEKGRQQLKTNNANKLKKFAGKFASDPTGFNPNDSTTWPTHNTGGAVDLTLRKKSTGELLDMGGPFDDATPISFTDALERGSKESAARNSRRILYNAMTRERFANYPYEWWHYDYGNQMWLQNTHAAEKAWYGPASLPQTKD
jgi:D-alanyl-D-alanine dipeptidase